jgi:hypothetical protein
VAHLFVHCRFTVIIWTLIKEWLGIASINQQEWHLQSLNEWWLHMTDSPSPTRKAVASLTLLVTLKIWNERNTRAFNNKHAPSTVILEKTKKEAKLWVAAGAKNLSNLLPGE